MPYHEVSSSTESGSNASRRRFLQTLGAGTIAATAGCLGGQNGGAATATPIQPPWTLQELRDAAEEEGGEFVSYIASPEEQEQLLVQAINEGLDMDTDFLSMNAVEGTSTTLGQRMMQETTQGQIQADIGSGIAPPLENTEFRNEYLEDTLHENFESFQPILDQGIILEDMIKPNKIQVGYGMLYHLPQWRETGYPTGPLEEDYLNAIALDDTYDGLSLIHNVDTNWPNSGSLLETYTAAADMGDSLESRREWARQLLDGLDILPVTSHSDGVRQSIAGEAPGMLMTYIRYVREFGNQGAEVAGIWPERFHVGIGLDGIFHLQNSPNPWAARFFMAALMELPVQQKILEYTRAGEYADLPARRDLDFSGFDPFLKNLAGQGVTEIEIVDASRTKELAEMAQNVLQPVYDELNLT